MVLRHEGWSGEEDAIRARMSGGWVGILGKLEGAVVLKRAELVEAVPVGRETLHRLRPGRLDEVRDWLAFFDSFWDNKLAALKAQAESIEP